MGLLTKLFGRKSTESGREPEPSEVVCLHTNTAAQWDSPDDMGHEDRASRFVCGACGKTFTPAEFEVLRASEAERVRNLMAVAPGPDDARD